MTPFSCKRILHRTTFPHSMAHSLNIQSDKFCSENGRSHGQSFECCWGEIVQDDGIENKRIDVLGTPPRPGFLFATYPA